MVEEDPIAQMRQRMIALEDKVESLERWKQFHGGIGNTGATMEAPHPFQRVQVLRAEQLVVQDNIWVTDSAPGIMMPLGASALTDAYVLRWTEAPPATNGDEVYIYASRASGDPYLYLYCREDGGDGFARVEIGDLTSSGYVSLLAAGGGDLSELIISPTSLTWGPVGSPGQLAVFGDLSELTIASGVITITTSAHTIETQGGAGTDDLDTINGGVAGQYLVVMASNSAHTVVAKDGTGNLRLAGDMSLDNAQDTLTLFYTGSVWLELSRSDNGA